MTANEMFARFNLGYEASRLFNRTFNEREVSDFLSKAELELIKQRFAAFRNSKQIGINNTVIPQANAVRSAELSGLLSGTAKIQNTKMIKGTNDNGALRGADLDQVTATQQDDNFGVFVPLPDEAMYILSESVDTVISDPSNPPTKYNVPVREVSIDEYHRGIYDTYTKPYDNLVWSLDWGTYTVQNVTGGLIPNSEKDYTLTGSGFNMEGDSADGTGTTIEINTARSRYLIPGSNYFIKTYQCQFLKKPSGITVDIVTPGAQVSSELSDFLHQEVVDLAVKLASASIVPEPNKYQVNQVESKEDE